MGTGWKEKVKARREKREGKISKSKLSKPALAKELFELTALAQARGWCAEELLAAEIKKQERQLRKVEASRTLHKTNAANGHTGQN